MATAKGIGGYGANDDTRLTVFLDGVTQAWSEAWKAGETGLAGD